jgi:hypothetical protein
MGMLFKLIPQIPHLNLKMKFQNSIHMATSIHSFNNLNLEAMNRKSVIRKGHTYHEDGIGTVTVLLAVTTVLIIFYSIYSAV